MGMYNDILLTDFGLGNFDKSATKQQFKDDANPDVLVQKYLKTGDSRYIFGNEKQPLTFASPDDFQESMNIVADATNKFSLLPADVRDKFKNDIGAFLSFMSDDANLPEAGRLGIIDYIPKPEVVSPVVANPEVPKVDSPEV